LSSGYLAFYTPIALLILWISYVAFSKRFPPRIWTVQMAVAVILIALALTPTMLAYNEVQKGYGLIRERSTIGQPLLPYMQPPEDIPKDHEKIGLTVSGCAEILLFLLAAGAALSGRLKMDGCRWGFLILTVLSFWMAFSEISPYQLIQNLPGFNGLRAAYRWYFIGITGLSVIFSLILTLLMEKNPSWMKFVIIAALGALLIYAIVPEDPADRPVERAPESHVYAFLKTVPPGPVCILPVEARGRLDFQIANSARMLYQLSYSYPMISGYSGFIPRISRLMERTLLDQGASKDVVQKLAKTGVKYCVVDNQMDEDDAAELENQLRANPQCKVLYDRNDEMVVQLPATIPETDMPKLIQLWSEK